MIISHRNAMDLQIRKDLRPETHKNKLKNKQKQRIKKWYYLYFYAPLKTDWRLKLRLYYIERQRFKKDYKR